MEQNTHWKTLMDKKYLGPYSLMIDKDHYREVVVKITKAQKEEVQNTEGKEMLLVLHFLNEKPMIVKPTNAMAISKAIGSPDTPDWIGKSITLYAPKIKLFGGFDYVLRVRDTMPVAALAALTPESKHWAGAVTSLTAGNTTIEKIRVKMTISPENEALLLSLSANDTEKQV